MDLSLAFSAAALAVSVIAVTFTGAQLVTARRASSLTHDPQLVVRRRSSLATVVFSGQEPSDRPTERKTRYVVENFGKGTAMHVSVRADRRNKWTKLHDIKPGASKVIEPPFKPRRRVHVAWMTADGRKHVKRITPYCD